MLVFSFLAGTSFYDDYAYLSSFVHNLYFNIQKYILLGAMSVLKCNSHHLGNVIFLEMLQKAEEEEEMWTHIFKHNRCNDAQICIPQEDQRKFLQIFHDRF